MYAYQNLGAVLTDIAGSWSINGQPASISHNADGSYTATNEKNDSANINYDPASGTIVVTGGIRWELDLHGTVSPDGSTISWANGTVWSRQIPAPVAITQPAPAPPPILYSIPSGEMIQPPPLPQPQPQQSSSGPTLWFETVSTPAVIPGTSTVVQPTTPATTPALSNPWLLGGAAVALFLVLGGRRRSA